MPQGNFPFIPTDPKNFPIRDLHKGVVLHKAPQDMAPGSLLRARNYLVNPAGLTRRPIYNNYASGITVDYPPLNGLASFHTLGGVQHDVLYDQKFIYALTSSAFTGKYWEYSAGDFTNTGTAVTGNGTLWDTTASHLQVGDVFVLDDDGSGAGPESATIATITDDTHIVLASTPAADYGGGTDYVIRRAFRPVEPYFIDHVAVYGSTLKLVFADSVRPPFSYDGNTFTELDSDLTDQGYVPSCLTYFLDRLWMGHIQEGASDYRHRIRWSNVDPNVDTFSTADYQDLPYSGAALRKLIPMGDRMMVYFEDALYIGIPSSFVGKPLDFKRIESGGIGLVGMKATVPWSGGHFFVGQNNIYYVSNKGVEAIGTPIIKESIDECSHLWKVFGIHDPQRDRVVFGFPKNTEEIEEFWSYNYKSKSWSSSNITGEMLAVGAFVDTVTWGTVAATPYSTGTVTMVDESTTLEGAGVDWVTASVVAGDAIFIDSLDDGDYYFQTTVDSVTDSDTIEMVDAADLSDNTLNYRIVAAAEDWDTKMTDYASWGAIQPGAPAQQTFYFGRAGGLFYFETGGLVDVGGSAPVGTIKTGDLDFGSPGSEKTLYEVSLKIQTPTDTALAFVVQGSINREASWKSLGTLRILVGKDEGKVSFRLTGSIIRLQFVCSTAIAPYTVNELVVRYRQSGTEIMDRND